jgi:hypothetical protein
MVTLAPVREGDVFSDVLLGVKNVATTDGFSEKLDVSVLGND